MIIRFVTDLSDRLVRNLAALHGGRAHLNRDGTWTASFRAAFDAFEFERDAGAEVL